ncbi:MAG: CoA transferase [Alphaproteobacteria bacterium]|nr:CoA transferase [Alphaproteobacteria bacterium]MDP6589981.1 CoA transferase [Alphaproteobacteria bacterium]MDP6819198.1 CoA transferase [Alphaproteobacteria bacterium]
MSFSFLDGVRVLDLSQYVPGPYATLLLADMGAEVVRVEPPGGEPMRRFGPPDADGISAWYKVVNGSKSVLEIDLKSAAGKADLERLIEGADAMLESYRPGVMERLGFGAERIKELNPRLVYCALSGWGQTGPYRERAGHDLNYMALMGGLVTSGPRDAPAIMFPQVADYSSGIQAALALMGGLMGRDRPGGSGQGCFIDTSIAEAVVPWQMWTLTGMLRPGFDIARGNIYLNGGTAFYNIYRTKDGRFMTLGAVEEKFWHAFCDTVGRPDWRQRQWETPPQNALIGELTALIAEKTMVEWETQFAEVDCCFERVHEMAEMVEHPHIKARAMVRPHDGVGGTDPFVEVLYPAWVDGKPPETRAPVRYRKVAEVIEEWT